LLTHEEMLALAAAGASGLQLRSIEFARSHGVRLHVRSTFAGEPGTWIVEENESVEKAVISGVAHTFEEAVYRVQGVGPSELFASLADRGVNVDTIIQAGADVIVFSAPLEDRGSTAGALDGLGATWSERDDLAKIGIVGAGMRSHPGIAARVFRTLDDLGIAAHFVSTSPVGITLYVSQGDAEPAVRGLHDAFELGSGSEGRDA
jgi:aspartate kinase